MVAEASTGRCTPFEMVFGVEGLAEERFPSIADEAARRSLALSRRDQFTHLESVGELLRLMVPESFDPAALDRYLEILFHCFHFWSAGCPLYAFERPVVRSLVQSAPDLSAWRLRAPQSSLYVEFPSNLFWAAVTEKGPPEPVEGLFVRFEADQQIAEADLLVVLGMRPDRPGFSVVDLAVDLERAHGLVEPDAFQSDIPGADLAELYSLQRSSEAMSLLLRLLWYVDVYPGSIEPGMGAGGGKPRNYGHGAPTSLDYYRVRLIERSHG